ncbi:MAG: hypothetical protein WCK29_03565, partial [archaeon]
LINETKEMIEKEINIIKKENNGNKLSRFFRPSKKASPEDESSNVTKQTERIINKSLMPEGLIKVENLKNDNPGTNIEQFEESSENNLALKLKKEQALKNSLEYPGSDAVRSIDDLERIKEKIITRKTEIAKQKAEDKYSY